MIKRINRIENFGIYQDYKHAGELKDFSTYNLFYGWNGCGKSTLSRVFRTLEKKELHENYRNARFRILVDDDLEVSTDNLDRFSEKIYVFNTDFIKENIDWDNTVNSILILSEKNIEDTKEYNRLNEELKGNKEHKFEGILKQVNDLVQKQIKEVDHIEKVLTDAAKNIKNSLGVIATNDSYYLSYNKGKLRSFIEKNHMNLKDTTSLLSRTQVENLIKQARPEKKDIVSDSRKDIEIKEINDIQSSLNEILCRKVTVNVLQRLKDNPTISDWVQNGIEIHKNNNSKICEFCGQVLPQNRISELESHFNHELKRLQNDLQSIEKRIREKRQNFELIKIEKLIFYPEFAVDVEKFNTNIYQTIEEINDIFDGWLSKLKNKQQNPFENVDITQEQLSDLVHKYNIEVERINKIIEMHNTKTKDFDNSIRIAKNTLELHFSKEQLNSFQYFKKQKEIDDKGKTIVNLKERINIIGKRLLDIEAKLSNETIGAQQFNQKIEKFIGYKDIYLKFSKDKRGYEILRATDGMPAKNLSEGEKSSIAFIYFMTKLKENGNKIEDSIIVIDDPISSFDSNKLFNAYAYLRSECENAKQLFIMTHNFNYFKLIMGWIKSKKHCFYKIETMIKDDSRIGCLNNAGIALKQTSEYDYIFSKIYAYHNKTELTRDELLNGGNIARKLVEAFLSFKYPKQRASIEQLLERAFPKGGDNDIIREKIYKFINVYSHRRKVDILGELDEDNVLSESTNIMNEILKMIERIDKTHYDDMVSWAEQELNA